MDLSSVGVAGLVTIINASASAIALVIHAWYAARHNK